MDRYGPMDVLRGVAQLLRREFSLYAVSYERQERYMLVLIFGRTVNGLMCPSVDSTESRSRRTIPHVCSSPLDVRENVRSGETSRGDAPAGVPGAHACVQVVDSKLQVGIAGTTTLQA